MVHPKPQLPRYDPQAVCPKCGTDLITLTYHEESEPLSLGSTASSHVCAGRGYGEHVCRQCQGCGYKWAESTLDAPAGTQQAHPGVIPFKPRKGGKR